MPRCEIQLPSEGREMPQFARALIGLGQWGAALRRRVVGRGSAPARSVRSKTIDSFSPL